MKYKEYDLHGFTEEDVKQKFYGIFEELKDIGTLRIITGKGSGIVQDTFIDLCKESNIDWKYDGSNTGALIIKYDENEDDNEIDLTIPSW